MLPHRSNLTTQPYTQPTTLAPHTSLAVVNITAADQVQVYLVVLGDKPGSAPFMAPTPHMPVTRGARPLPALIPSHNTTSS